MRVPIVSCLSGFEHYVALLASRHLRGVSVAAVGRRIHALDYPQLLVVLRVFCSGSVVAAFPVVLAEPTHPTIVVVLSLPAENVADLFQQDAVGSFDFSVLGLFEGDAFLLQRTAIRAC